MHCTSLTHSGKSELIAAHIHMVPAEEGEDGATGEGPPVVNFCGKNGVGLIQDGTPYTQPCSQWDQNGAAHNSNMPGTLVPSFNRGMAAAERVEDIAKRPHAYYFNFHSMASWTRWYPVPHGICRGQLQLQGVEEEVVNPGPPTSTTTETTTRTTTVTTTTTTTTLTTSVTPTSTTTTAVPGKSSSLRGSKRCYNFFSQLNVNPLQVYHGNPDSQIFGFATCKLCTDGAMHCTSLTHSGKSELIAAHIHMVPAEEGEDGATGEGPPVVNFCGKNGVGLIQDGTPYTQPCSQWDQNGAAHNSNMPGTLVPNFNRGMTAAERVEDIAKRPHAYYFNFHSMASWAHWYPVPHGICRGQLELQGVEEEVANPGLRISTSTATTTKTITVTTTTATTTLTTSVTSTSTTTAAVPGKSSNLRGSKRCYNFFSQMNVN